MKVTIINKIVQTGEHRAKKGETVEVPDEIGKVWVAIGAAREADAEETKKAKK